MTTWTINSIQEAMRARGSHWWDADSMRFFGTRAGEQVYQGPGGVYFVTSEKPPHGKRAYCVRQFHPEGADIDTIGEVASLSRAQAHRLAATMAATSLQDQFTSAMLALDKAVTGEHKARQVTQYETIEDARDGRLIYLSDGGYTRCNAHRYEDGSGWYLQLTETGATDRKPAWSDAWELQREVCRALKTEPAGESAIVAAEAHSPVSDADDFARTMQSESGMTRAAADIIRRLARRHQRMMVDYCNGVDIYDQDNEPIPELARLRTQIRELCSPFGVVPVFSGDPRGATVKLRVPSGKTDDWGDTGICVPTA